MRPDERKMPMSFRKTLLAATMLALPLAAQAQPVTGLYVAGGAGVNWHPNVTADLAPGATQRVESSLGWVAVGSIGWGFGNGLRLELEGNYRNNDVDRVNFAEGGPIAGVSRSGYISTYGAMVNALYDFNLGY